MANQPPVPNNTDDRKRDLLKEVQQDRAAGDPVSSSADFRPPMPTLQMPGVSSSLEETVRSLVVDTFKDTVQKMTINGITPDVSGSSVSFSIPVAPKASEQFQAINPPAIVSPATPVSPASVQAPLVPITTPETATASQPTLAAPVVNTTQPPTSAIPEIPAATPASTASATPPVLISPIMPSTAGVVSSTTGTPNQTATSEAPLPPSFVTPAPSLNLSTPSLPTPNVSSPPPPPSAPETPAPRTTAGESFKAQDTAAREFTQTAIENKVEGFSMSAPTSGLEGMRARQARTEAYKEAGMDMVSVSAAEEEFTQQQKSYQTAQASGMKGDASDVLRGDGGILSDKRGRNEMRGEFEARIEERNNLEKQNGANVSEAIKNGDSSYLSKGFVPVLFTRGDGRRKIVVQLDNSCASVIEGAAAGEKVGALPADNAYYLADKGGTYAFRLTPFTEGNQAKMRITYGEINGTPPSGMVKPSLGNPEGGYVFTPTSGYIYAIVTIQNLTRVITSRSIGYATTMPTDSSTQVHFMIGQIETVAPVGNNPATYRILHQAQAGHIQFRELYSSINGVLRRDYFHVYTKEAVLTT
jgi:hypothetical protein